MYKIVYSRQAAHEIKKLPRHIIPRILNKVGELAAEPRPLGVVKLATFTNLWRIRVGDYRIIYSVDDEIRAVDVRHVVNRKDAY